MTERLILTEVTTGGLLARTTGEFFRASELIASISDRIYCFGSENNHNIGAHIRHNFDFAQNFIAGLATSKIDYSTRQREIRIEQDRQFAIERLGYLIARFEALPSSQLDKPVYVRSEINESVWYASSSGRELEFLYSHTVHHHAMVAEKLKALDIDPPSDFGVSSSTLKFWDKQENSKLRDVLSFSAV